MPNRRRKKERDGPTSNESTQSSDNVHNEYVESFYTTTWVYLEKGAARIPRCCLDSGYTGRGAEGLINPSVVDFFAFERSPAKRTYTLADGSSYTTTAVIRLPLTFQAYGYARTIDVDLYVRNTDSSIDNILLSTGVQYALHGTHSHRTNPSTFTILNPLTNAERQLAPDTPAEPGWPCADVLLWLGKQEGDYIGYMIYSWAFKNGGWSTLPPVAYTRIGSSSHVFYECDNYGYYECEGSGGEDEQAIRSSCAALIEWLAKCEREKYAELAYAAKGKQVIPQELAKEVAKFFDAAAVLDDDAGLILDELD